ncbi:MAG: hypothetical protein GY751_08390 [Bacteroidetes bacterium]|nr:hypothetical protein [Bacteroidota bacterium]
MEKDDEVSGDGNQYDYGFRIYNPRIARFLSVDPLAPKFPMLTPYQFASNTPIQAIDLDGLEATYYYYTYDKQTGEVAIDRKEVDYNFADVIEIHLLSHGGDVYSMLSNRESVEGLAHQKVQAPYEYTGNVVIESMPFISTMGDIDAFVQAETAGEYALAASWAIVGLVGGKLLDPVFKRGKKLFKKIFKKSDLVDDAAKQLDDAIEIKNHPDGSFSV